MHCALAKSSPIRDTLDAGSIPIMPETVESDGQLLIHWQLRVIRVVVENGVVFQGYDKSIESRGVDPKSLAKVVRAAEFQGRKNVVEIGRAVGKRVAWLFITHLVHDLNLLPDPSP
jgi:hypothetical protein